MASGNLASLGHVSDKPAGTRFQPAWLAFVGTPKFSLKYGARHLQHCMSSPILQERRSERAVIVELSLDTKALIITAGPVRSLCDDIPKIFRRRIFTVAEQEIELIQDKSTYKQAHTSKFYWNVTNSMPD